MTDFWSKLAQRAETACPPAEGDYQQDGLWYCGVCRSPKQCRLAISGRVRVVSCQCACASRRYEAEREARRQEEERLRIDSLRLTGIADLGLRDCRFETAEETALIARCRRYAERWEEARSQNLGLLLWGDTGGGKTYAAACIANAVIDRGVPALITGFSQVLAAGWEEREEFLRNAGRFPLLVLDDLGAEQDSSFSLRAVYGVINERYKSRRPLIVTTNLSLQELRQPRNMDCQRIYERVLEMCVPVRVDKQPFRARRTAEKLAAAREILGAEP